MLSCCLLAAAVIFVISNYHRLMTKDCLPIICPSAIMSKPEYREDAVIALQTGSADIMDA